MASIYTCESMGIGRSSLLSMPPDIRSLHVAVMKNDVAMVQELVESGIDLDYPWQSAEPPSIKDGSTPLCEAVSLNHRSVIQVLLQAGACVNKSDSFGCTPLHKASYHGRALLCELLLVAGADVHTTDHNQNTPLNLCAQNALVHNSAETVRVLIRAGSKVNHPNRFGKTALHYAALWGLGEITEILIKANAEMDKMDHKWKTPLYCCIRAITVFDRKKDIFLQHLPSIKVLIMNGCDTLNIASWMRRYQVLSSSASVDDEFYRWYSQSQPESLKQLCRQSIQKHLRYHDESAPHISKLPLPKSLILYLERRLL